MNTNELRDIIQDCNLNFLIGSGLSSPYFALLGSVETLLDQLAALKLSSKIRRIVEASLYQEYFDGVIDKNLELLKSPETAGDVFRNYKEFLQTINTILLYRKSTILSKHVNLFTTNIDVLLELALDQLDLEYNDGFSGRFRSLFSLSNFGKFSFRRSLHFDNISEVPVFNVLKLHGSLTWAADSSSGSIIFSPDLWTIQEIRKNRLTDGQLPNVSATSTLEELVAAAREKGYSKSVDRFLNTYRRLLIINPTKEKFADTLFNQAYYDLLRLYSNELEKENTVLFVMGFSFRDAHIRDLTIRVANSNPTLTVIVLAHTARSKQSLDTILSVDGAKNKNIKVLAPPVSQPLSGDATPAVSHFDFSGINRQLFSKLLEAIEMKGQGAPGASGQDGATL